MSFGEVWNLIIANPILNVLVALTNLLGGSFGLAIISLTIIVRLVSWPLTNFSYHYRSFSLLAPYQATAQVQ